MVCCALYLLCRGLLADLDDGHPEPVEVVVDRLQQLEGCQAGLVLGFVWEIQSASWPVEGQSSHLANQQRSFFRIFLISCSIGDNFSHLQRLSGILYAGI